MINLCIAARTFKKAACPYHVGTKEVAALSVLEWGLKVRWGEQVRRHYLPAARWDNEDKSWDQRAISK